MVFVPISTVLIMLLFQGYHVVCLNFILTGLRYFKESLWCMVVDLKSYEIFRAHLKQQNKNVTKYQNST